MTNLYKTMDDFGVHHCPPNFKNPKKLGSPRVSDSQAAPAPSPGRAIRRYAGDRSFMKHDKTCLNIVLKKKFKTLHNITKKNYVNL